MSIRVVQTEAIKAQLRTILGKDYDLEDIVVYELVSIDSGPLATTFPYRLATVSGKAMTKLSKLAASRSVPLITQHDTQGPLPVGRVFYNKVYEDLSGNFSLHSLIYLSQKGEPEVVAKLDSGIIRDASVQFEPSSMICTLCNYDFLKAKDGQERIRRAYWDDEPLTCGNSHTMGVTEGAKLSINDAKKWKELSLVTRGASEGARILSAKFQKLAKEDFKLIPLAASIDDDTLTVSTFNPDSALVLNQPDEETPMDNKDLIAQVEARVKAEMKLEAAKTDAELDAAKLKIADLEAKLAAKAPESKAEDTKVPEAEDQTKLAEAEKVKAAASELETLKAEKLALTTQLAVAKGLNPDGTPKAEDATKTPVTAAMAAVHPSAYTFQGE